VFQTIRLCVGLSGRPRDTAAQVAAVARLRTRLPAADDVLRVLGRLADDATGALAVGDVDGLGRIFDAAHGLLAALRLSGPELDAMVNGARAAGAIGAKLTGAGGGGAVIALAPGHERDVLARWREAGFDGFLAEIAATPGHAPEDVG
jgi:mevalonate kinase